METKDTQRTCGECRLCCKVLAVPHLGKPAHQWCEHVCDKGCSIYQERPAACSQFSCLWLLGKMPLEDRPDRLKVVFCDEKDDDGTPLVVIYESYPGAAQSKKVSQYINESLKAGWRVVIRNTHSAIKRLPDGRTFTATIDTSDPLRMRMVGVEKDAA